MTMQSVQSPLALRPREAAKALGISPRLLWQLTHDGHIPCVRVGSGKRRTVLYPTANLQAWLSQQAETAKGGNDVSPLNCYCQSCRMPRRPPRAGRPGAPP